MNASLEEEIKNTSKLVLKLMDKKQKELENANN